MNAQGKNRLNREKVCDESEIESEIVFASWIASARGALNGQSSPEIIRGTCNLSRNSAVIHVTEWKHIEMPHAAMQRRTRQFLPGAV
ncbi:MAG: hypothetical protein V4458_14635 [Pseudomonadota bacterium]|nr:hypothetical protein [Afipia sp.]